MNRLYVLTYRAAIRAAEIGESPDSFGAGIRLTLARPAEFGGSSQRADALRAVRLAADPPSAPLPSQ